MPHPLHLFGAAAPDMAPPAAHASRQDSSARSSAIDSQPPESRTAIAVSRPVAASPVSVSRQDRQLRYTWIFGATPGAATDLAIGRSDHELLPVAAAAQITELKQRVLDGGQPLRAEVLIDTAAGARCLELTVEPLRGADGEIDGVTSVVLDVTAQRCDTRAHEARKAQESGYQALFDNALNGVAHCQMYFENGEPVGWRYLAANAAFGRQTGLGDVAGKMVDEVIPGLRSLDPQMLQTYARVVTSGKGERFEVYVRALDLWFEITAFPTGGERFAAIFSVITRRKQMEAALQESATRLSLAQRVGRLGVFDADLSTGAVICTPELAQLLGLSLAQAPATSTGWLEKVIAEDREMVRSTFRKWCRGTVADVELAFRIARPDGEIRWMLVRASILRDASGAARRLVGAQADITDRRRLESEILTVSAGEQRRLAAELHDGIGQQLIGLSFMAAGLAAAARQGANPEVAALDRLTEVAHQTMSGIRSLAHGLAPGGVGASSLPDALSRLASVTEQLHGIPVDLVLRGGVPRAGGGHCRSPVPDRPRVRVERRQARPSAQHRDPLSDPALAGAAQRRRRRHRDAGAFTAARRRHQPDALPGRADRRPSHHRSGA